MPSKYYETRKAYFQKWYKKNKKKYLKKSRETYKKNRKKYLARRKEIRVIDPERYKAYSKNWNKKNPEKRALWSKRYRKNNKLKYAERQRKWAKKNRVKINGYMKKIRSTPQGKIASSLRARVQVALKNKKLKKSNITFQLVGCSINFLKKYLEKRFKEGMSWRNYGFYGWHIDHIKPVSKFNLLDPKQQKKCFNYKNLQPLWAKENFLKSNKYFASE